MYEIREIISNRRDLFMFLILFLVILLCSSFVHAETILEHTTDLNVYRFTQILDISEDGNVDIWLLIELRFEEDENPSNDYVLKFEIYPTDEEIEIFPSNPEYFNFLKNTTTQTGNESFVRFVVDKSASQEYEYFSFGCKYQPRVGSVIRKASIEGESYNRWKLNHYSGIHQSIGNYVRKFIIIPESAKIKDLGDFETNDEVLNKFELFAKLRYSNYEIPKDNLPVHGFDDIRSRDARILFQINLEEVHTTLEYEIFHRPPQEYLIIIHVGVCLFLCLIAGFVIIKNSNNIRRFTIIISGALLLACVSPLTSFHVYGDIQTMVGILVTLLALILGVYTIGTSKHYADRTERLISDFEDRQDKKLAGIDENIDNLRDAVVNNIINGVEESVPIQEDNPSKQNKLKDEIKKPQYKDETLKLVEMVTSEIQRFFPVKTEVLSPTKEKRIDLLIKLPDNKVIPVEIKRFSKRLVKEKIPTQIVEMLKSTMKDFDTKKSIVIIMNKGVGKKAEQIFKDVSPETIHLIKGTTVETVRKNLIKFLREPKKRYPET